MLIIGNVIGLVFVLITKIIFQDLLRNQNLPSINNKSNVSLSSLLSDSLLDSWLHDSSRNDEWKVPFDQHFESSERRSDETSFNSEFSAMNIQGFSNETKEHFLESFLRPPSTKVEPDWSVVLGTFEHYADDNWENYLTITELPYLLRLIVGSMSETITFSRILNKDGKIEKNTLGAEMGTTSADYEIQTVASIWPFSLDHQFPLGKPILEQNIVDGSYSLNTYFFATPCILIHDKIKDPWKMISMLHFYEQGLNMTIIERERMVMTSRYLKRVE